MVGLGFLGCYYKELVTSPLPALPSLSSSFPPSLLSQTHMETSFSDRPSQALLTWGAGSGVGDKQVGMVALRRRQVCTGASVEVKKIWEGWAGLAPLGEVTLVSFPRGSSLRLFFEVDETELYPEFWVPVWSCACFLLPWVAEMGDSSRPRCKMGPRTPTCKQGPENQAGDTCL